MKTIFRIAHHLDSNARSRITLDPSVATTASPVAGTCQGVGLQSPPAVVWEWLSPSLHYKLKRNTIGDAPIPRGFRFVAPLGHWQQANRSSQQIQATKSRPQKSSQSHYVTKNRLDLWRGGCLRGQQYPANILQCQTIVDTC